MPTKKAPALSKTTTGKVHIFWKGRAEDEWKSLCGKIFLPGVWPGNSRELKSPKMCQSCLQWYRPQLHDITFLNGQWVEQK